jgi:hypothetical protein
MTTPTAATKALLELPVLHLKLKLRPDQESMDSIILDNGSPPLKVNGMLTCLEAWCRNPTYEPMHTTSHSLS